MLDAAYDGAAEIERAWRDGLTPDPLLTTIDGRGTWAAAHRASASSAVM